MKIYNALSYSIKSDLRYYGENINRALVSYHAIRQSPGHIDAMTQHSRLRGAFFLDSGAFSAKTANVAIDVDEYGEFIIKNRPIFHCYANLDIIGDAKGTNKNQRYLESKGLAPLPVFHFGSDLLELELLAREYDYICLGGLVPLARQTKVLKNWLDKCFSIIKLRKNKIHLFGITSREILMRYPAYSCDSTSAFEGSIRGSISDILSGKKLNEKFDPRAFRVMDRNSKLFYRDRVNFMMKGTKQLEGFITNFWSHHGVIWNETSHI